MKQFDVNAVGLRIRFVSRENEEIEELEVTECLSRISYLTAFVTVRIPLRKSLNQTQMGIPIELLSIKAQLKGMLKSLI